MKLRCPVCHSSNSLDAYTEDAAQRELLALLGKNVQIFWPLVSYLGLFRSANRDLANSRALRLATEVLALGADPRALAAALSETVESLRQKREDGDVRPLTGHNYLRRVLESTVTVGARHASPAFDLAQTGEACLAPTQAQQQPAPRGKRAQGLANLAEWAND